MGTKRKHHFEPSWQDGKGWPCTVGFFPTDDPEARLYSAEIIGYLVGYADPSKTRALVLLGDPDASAYVLFSFSTPEEGPVPRSGPLLEDLGDDSGTCFTNPPLCINKQQLRERFAIIDRALEIMDKSVGKLDELRGPRRPGGQRLEYRVNYGDDWGCFTRPCSDSANTRIKYVDEAQENPT